MATVDEFKKLNPEERIKRLKELEEERKREIAEAEDLIKETARELAEAEEKRRIPIPEARATELSTLNTIEEKQLVATHHLLTAETAATHQPQSPQQPKSLEEVAAEEAPPVEQQSQQQLMQRLQKPEYAIGTEQQRPAFGEYLSKSQPQIKALRMLAEKLKSKKWQEKELYNECYTIAKESGLQPPEFFRAAYMVLLNKERGPKLAPFLLALGDKAVRVLEKV